MYIIYRVFSFGLAINFVGNLFAYRFRRVSHKFCIHTYIHTYRHIHMYIHTDIPGCPGENFRLSLGFGF